MIKLPPQFLKIGFIALWSFLGAILLFLIYGPFVPEAYLLLFLIPPFILSVLFFILFDVVGSRIPRFSFKQILLLLVCLLFLSGVLGLTIPKIELSNRIVELGGLQFFFFPVILYIYCVIPIILLNRIKLFKTIGSAVLVIVLLYIPFTLISLSLSNFIHVTLSSTSSVNEIPKNEVNRSESANISSEKGLPEGKIAYIRNGNVILLSPQKEQKLSTDGHATSIKWSKDGKYIGWINNVNVPDLERYVGGSISVVNIATGEVKNIVSKTPDVDKYQYIYDFDFSADSNQIAYLYDGVWLKDIVSGTETKILSNTVLGKTFADNSYYIEISWSSDGKKILLTKTLRESLQAEIYDMAAKSLYGLPEYTPKEAYKYLWSADGKSIISFRSGGRLSGGMWLTSLDDKSTTTILGKETPGSHWENNVSVYSVAESRNGVIISSFDTFVDLAQITTTPTPVLLPYSGVNIYLVKISGEIAPLTKIQKKGIYNQQVPVYLGWSPDGRYISYILSTPEHNIQDGKGSLHIMDPGGANDRVIVNDIASYSWSPEK